MCRLSDWFRMFCGLQHVKLLSVFQSSAGRSYYSKCWLFSAQSLNWTDWLLTTVSHAFVPVLLLDADTERLEAEV